MGYARSFPSFDAPVGSHALPGFVGVNLGHFSTCPAPSLVPFGREPLLQRSLVDGDDRSDVFRRLPIGARLSGMAPLESEGTRFSSRFTALRASRFHGEDAFRSFTEGWEFHPTSNVK